MTLLKVYSSSFSFLLGYQMKLNLTLLEGYIKFNLYCVRLFPVSLTIYFDRIFILVRTKGSRRIVMYMRVGI